MKPEKSRHSLKWRLYAFIIFFILIIVFILWVFQVVLLEYFYKEIKLREVKALSDTLVYVLKDEVEDEIIKNKVETVLGGVNDSSVLDLYLAKKINNNEIFILQPANNSSSNKFNPDIKILNNIWNKAISENLTSFFIETSDLENYQLHVPTEFRFKIDQEIIYCQFYKDVQGKQCMLLLNSQLVPMKAAIQTFQFQLTIIIIILLILGIAIAFMMGKFISKPLEDLTKSAKQLAGDRKNLVFKGEGYQEVMDLSEALNYATKEIQKSENLQKDLISNVSHELRTPLTLIAGYSEMMKDIPGERTEENLNVIINETKRLSGLVNDVLTLSKIQSRVDKDNYEEFNINLLIEDVINSFNIYSSENKVKISFVQDGQYKITANEQQINQVLYNFVANAVNYSKGDAENQEVIITLKKVEQGLWISVKDFGIGIKESELNNIWNRYYKVYDSQKKKSIGSGLGLAIVKEILEVHEYNYGVISEYSVGSEFWVIIPNKNMKKEI